MSAAAVLDTLTMLKSTQETLLAALEQACGSCDSLCEEYAHSDENAEAILQTIPSELLARLRKRGLCLRQLARHLVKGDTIYEKAGFTEGQGNEAKLEEPCQMDLDEEGNIYVAVRKKHRIAKITPDGMLTNYTGTGTSGTTDGPLDKAQFNHPEGVQFGPDGALYISDYWNHKIRKIEKD